MPSGVLEPDPNDQIRSYGDVVLKDGVLTVPLVCNVKDGENLTTSVDVLLPGAGHRGCLIHMLPRHVVNSHGDSQHFSRTLFFELLRPLRSFLQSGIEGSKHFCYPEIPKGGRPTNGFRFVGPCLLVVDVDLPRPICVA